MEIRALKLPAIQLYVGDFLRDNVCGCSLSAQGLWLRMMFIMHDCEPYGHLSQSGLPLPDKIVAARCGTDLGSYKSLLAELKSAGVPSFTDDGVLFSRRMVRDEERRRYEREKKRAQRGGGLSPDCPDDVPEMSPGSSMSTSSSTSLSPDGESLREGEENVETQNPVQEAVRGIYDKIRGRRLIKNGERTHAKKQ